MKNFSIQNLEHLLYITVIIALVLIGGALVVAFCHYITKNFLIKIIDKSFSNGNTKVGRLMFKQRVFHRIAYLIPAILLYLFAFAFDIHYHGYKIYLADLVRMLTSIYVIIVSSLTLSAVLNCIHVKYARLEIAKQRPIKSYLQVVKIILFIATGILAISVLLEKSPTYFFTGLGAITAVLLLVFKDSILGFVASIQLAAYDMVRIGDWIEMPNFGADGEITDISLNTIKVQNFDKTIVTIPSYSLLSSGIKNWRGMHESGGRRIKRSIHIDITSIKFCDKELLDRLHQITGFKENLTNKISEVNAHNAQNQIDTSLPINGKQLTNIGIFRHYLENYLHNYSGIHKDMKILVRHLQAGATGLPVEIYAYTDITNSEIYETIQADIFDHIYAALPIFDLRAFQHNS
jgi:miniconductance mechanosensitive channel